MLVVTNMWPGEGSPYTGIFVRQQVDALRRVAPERTFDVLTIAGHRGRGDYLLGARRIRERLNDYDVVNAHYGLTAATVALASIGRTAPPLVMTLHGGDAYIGWQRAISLFAARRSAEIIAVSPGLREDFGRETDVIPCGVPTEIFQPDDAREARRRLGLPLDRPVVLFPADPGNPVKNHELFEAAISMLRRRSMDPVVLTLGDLDPAHVPERMVAADVVVLTSHNEGSPMVVKEALASGKPVVSVNVGDVASVLDGVPGCATTSRTPEAVADGIAGALRDPERLISGGRERRARVFQLGLDESSIARRVLEVLDRAARAAA